MWSSSAIMESLIRELIVEMNSVAGSFSTTTTSPPVGHDDASPPLEKKQPLPLSYRDRVLHMYEHYNPQKVHTVDRALARYAGQEEELMKVLVHKYGPEPTAVITSTDREPFPVQGAVGLVRPFIHFEAIASHRDEGGAALQQFDASGGIDTCMAVARAASAAAVARTNDLPSWKVAALIRSHAALCVALCYAKCSTADGGPDSSRSVSVCAEPSKLFMLDFVASVCEGGAAAVQRALAEAAATSGTTTQHNRKDDPLQLEQQPGDNGDEVLAVDDLHILCVFMRTILTIRGIDPKRCCPLRPCAHLSNLRYSPQVCSVLCTQLLEGNLIESLSQWAAAFSISPIATGRFLLLLAEGVAMVQQSTEETAVQSPVKNVTATLPPARIVGGTPLPPWLSATKANEECAMRWWRLIWEALRTPLTAGPAALALLRCIVSLGGVILPAESMTGSGDDDVAMFFVQQGIVESTVSMATHLLSLQSPSSEFSPSGDSAVLWALLCALLVRANSSFSSSSTLRKRSVACASDRLASCFSYRHELGSTDCVGKMLSGVAQGLSFLHIEMLAANRCSVSTELQIELPEYLAISHCVRAKVSSNVGAKVHCIRPGTADASWIANCSSTGQQASTTLTSVCCVPIRPHPMLVGVASRVHKSDPTAPAQCVSLQLDSSPVGRVLVDGRVASSVEVMCLSSKQNQLCVLSTATTARSLVVHSSHPTALSAKADRRTRHRTSTLLQTSVPPPPPSPQLPVSNGEHHHPTGHQIFTHAEEPNYICESCKREVARQCCEANARLVDAENQRDELLECTRRQRHELDINQECIIIPLQDEASALRHRLAQNERELALALEAVKILKKENEQSHQVLEEQSVLLHALKDAVSHIVNGGSSH